MRDSDLERIRNLKLFAAMSADNFTEMIQTADLQSYPSGKRLLSEGDSVDFLNVLLDGAVEMRGTWHGRQTTVAVARPLSLFILSSVILNSPVLLSVHTMQRCEVLRISAEVFRDIMRRDAAFATAVAEEMAGWNRTMVRQVKDVKLRTSAERVANYLLTLQIQQGGGDVIRLDHEKRILASLLGMTPENLSRAFSNLSSYGVEVNGHEVRLTSPGALRELARPSPFIDNHMPPQDHLGGTAERELWPMTDADKAIIG